MKKRDIVLLSTAEWDNPFWTNKQHVAVELAKLGHRVFYIDSLGLRRPSVNSQDISRIARRIEKALRCPRKVQNNLWVWSPLLLPFQSIAAVRNFNRIILNRWLDHWLKRLDFDKDIFWTYNPLTSKLFSTEEYDKLIYHCVDEIKAQPGMPVHILEEAENELVTRSDFVFTTSRHLYETRKRLNPHTHYFSNVADFDHFSKAIDAETAIPEDLLAIPKPRIGFIGAISGYKIDFNLIEYLAKAHPYYSFVLIGKVGEGDPWTNIEQLKNLKNIYLLGPRPYASLPCYLKGFDVAMLPNNLNEYTKSMFPMKFFEYLAAGKPVVSTDLDSLKEFESIIFLSQDYQEFSTNLSKALEHPKENLEEGLALAKKFTYESRTRKMLDIIEGV